MKRKLLGMMLAITSSMQVSLAEPVASSPAQPSVQPTTQAQKTSQTTNANGFTQKTLTLQDINGLSGFNLRGASAGKLFFIPILPQWNLDNIQMHFVLYHAALSKTGITLTLMVNDNPIGSKLLEGLASSSETWDVTLPKELLNTQNLNLKITSNAGDFGFNCYNLTSPSYWVFVSGNSTVTYNYTEQNFKPDLTKFPFPFINDPGVQKDTVIILLPNNPNFKNLTAGFYLANALAKRQSWRGLNFITTSPAQLTDEEKKANNLIFVGTPNEFNFSALATKWPLNIDANNAVTDNNNNAIEPNTGVILLAPSTWNQQAAMLAVTGNSDDAVIKSAQALRDPNFNTTVLFNEYALIEQVPQFKEIKRVWKNTTLADLGFKDQAIYGVGENTIAYPIELPLTKIPSKLDLIIKYAVSPFLSATQSSFMSLRVNDIPMDGTVVGNEHGQLEWKVSITGNKLNPGKNNIAFTFNLKLKNRDCTPEDASLAWATIYSQSELNAIFDNEMPYLSFSTFSGAAENIIIALPNDNNLLTDKLFQNQLLTLSSGFANFNSIHFIANNALRPETDKDSDIIFVGGLEDNQALAALKTKIPFYYQDKKLMINSFIRPFVSISDEVPTAILEVIPSPFNPEKLMLIVSALDASGYQLGFELLTNPKKFALINGNIVLAYQNGTFTSLQSQKLTQQAENKKRINDVGNLVYIIGGVLFGIIFFSIVGSIIYRRAKRYFKPKQE